MQEDTVMDSTLISARCRERDDLMPLLDSPSQKKHKQESVGVDPYSVLPEDAFIEVLSWLSPEQLAQCSLVCQDWREVVNSKPLWHRLCHDLWATKVYVPKYIREVKTMDPKLAYRCSLKDSTRNFITEEELFTFEWNFRFKKFERHEWSEKDPWWNDKPPSKHRYMPNGEIKVNGEFTGIQPDERRWRWIPRMLGKDGPHGSFIQVNAYPSYVFSRMENWGFIQQSSVAVLTSFPMPPKGKDPELEDDSLEAMLHRSQPFEASRSRRYALQHVAIPMQLLDTLLRNGLIDDEGFDTDDSTPMLPMDIHTPDRPVVDDPIEDPAEAMGHGINMGPLRQSVELELD